MWSKVCFINGINDDLLKFGLWAKWDDEERIIISRTSGDAAIYIADNERVANAFLHGMVFAIGEADKTKG